MSDKISKEEIIKCGNRLLELSELDIVKEYADLLHKVVNYPKEEPTKEYYKSSKKYDYYIVYPYEEFTILLDGKYGFKQHLYDAIGRSEATKSTLYFGRGLCNYSKERIIELIEKSIEEDNKEV